MSIEATADSINKATCKVSNETDAFKIDLKHPNDCGKDNLIVVCSVYTVQCSVYTALRCTVRCCLFCTMAYDSDKNSIFSSNSMTK